MNILRATIGAVIGGLIGAAVWAAIMHFASLEIGWIAWGIGALVGFGAATAARGETNAATGVLAAIVALASVSGGKMLAVEIAFRDAVGLSGSTLSEEEAIVSAAHAYALHWEEQGRDLDWPRGMSYDEAHEREHYPPECIKAAERDWAELEPELRELCRRAPWLIEAEYRQGFYAAEIAADRASQGRDLGWPAGAEPADAVREADFPADVWRAAASWRNSLSVEQRVAFLEPIVEQNERAMAEFFNDTMSSLKEEAFIETWGILDILFVGLAVFTAFGLGSGMQREG